MSCPPALCKLRDCAGEILTALYIPAHQAHFPQVIPTPKHVISLWASGVSRKEIFPNDSLTPKRQGWKSSELSFYDSLSCSHAFQRSNLLWPYPIPDHIFFKVWFGVGHRPGISGNLPFSSTRQNCAPLRCNLGHHTVWLPYTFVKIIRGFCLYHQLRAFI